MEQIMCGMIGYAGPLEAKDVLLKGLTGLEYRRYDSAGTAYFNQDFLVRTIKKVGEVIVLRECIKSAGEISHYGVGHTRWATHRGVIDTNAHPYSFEQITLIHDGTIENYRQLAQEYELEGRLVSQTDSKMAATVLDSAHRECGQDPPRIIMAFTGMLGGSHSFCILFADCPGETYAVKKISPLVASHTHSRALVVSDLTTLISYAREYFVIPGGYVVCLTSYKVCVYDMDFSRVEPETLEVSWDMGVAMKNGYSHFVLKKIRGQPDALKNTIPSRMVGRLPDFRNDGIPDSIFVECTQIHIIACGTAIHAGVVAKALIEPMLRIPVTMSTTSEFRYEDPLIDSKTLVMVISQSGGTTDMLVTMNLARSLGSPTLSITNVRRSTIVRESDYVSYAHVGLEITVTSTKAYSVQLAALYVTGCRMALIREAFSCDMAKEFMKGLMDVIPAVGIMTEQSESIQSFVRHLIRERDTFFTGRDLDYAFSLKGVLKLKEIPYVHTEAYATGELKHRTIVLIYGNVPVITVATQDHVFTKTISSIREVEVRGAYVTLLTEKQSAVEDGVTDVELRIPDLEDRFTVFPIAAALQLVTYYVSIGKHPNVGQLRNLTRSVTVEQQFHGSPSTGHPFGH